MIDFLTNFLQLDVEYFFKQGFWLTLSYIFNTACGLILVYLYANFVDISVYGEYVFLLSLLSFISIFSLVGMGQAITYSLSENFYGNFKESIKVTLKFSALGSLVFIVLFFKYLFDNNLTLSYSFLILATVFPLYSISTYYQSFLISDKKFKELSFINILTISVVLISTGLVIFLKLGTIHLLIASIFPPLLINTIILTYWLKLHPTGKIEKSFIKMGWHLSVTQSLHFFSKNLDKVLVGFLLPIESLAIYAFALVIPEQASSFTKYLITLAIPKLAELSEKDIRKSMIIKFFYAEIIVLIFVLFYILVAPVIFNYLFPKFLSSLNLSQIYVLTLFSLPVNLLSLSFQKFKLNPQLYAQEIINSASLIALILLLVPIFGLAGAIYAQVGTKILYTLTSLLIFYFSFIKKA